MLGSLDSKEGGNRSVGAPGQLYQDKKKQGKTVYIFFSVHLCGMSKMPLKSPGKSLKAVSGTITYEYNILYSKKKIYISSGIIYICAYIYDVPYISFNAYNVYK